MRKHIRVEDNSRKTATIFSTLHQRHFENTTEDLWPIKYQDNIQKQFHYLQTSLSNKASLRNDMFKNGSYTVPYNCDKDHKDETSYSPNQPKRTWESHNVEIESKIRYGWSYVERKRTRSPILSELCQNNRKLDRKVRQLKNQFIW